MVFSSLFFIYIFLPVCLVLYYVTPKLKLKNYILTVLSVFFYAMGEPIFVIMLLISSGSAYGFAFLINKFRGTGRARLFLALSATVTVSFLFFFKYFVLFVETANSLFGASFAVPDIVLPIGISFYTFQILTYTVDVYYGKAKLQRSFMDFLLFVSLFPQLIAGPILRYTDIEEQLSYREHSLEKFAGGVVIFVCGLAKKVLIADFAGNICSQLLGSSDVSTLSAWFGLLMFTFQIYFDFSGYSDMAVGLGRMFGFEYVKNFDYPYSSKSITEFWRRWHMSLGTFFRDYVYIPLGGNRTHHIRNIAVVWLLTGFWHGASWNFALWGVYYGVLLIIEKYVLSRIRIKTPTVIRCALCMFVVMIGWVLFYYTDMGQMWNTLTRMFVYHPETAIAKVQLVRESIIFAAVCFVGAMPWLKKLALKAGGALRQGFGSAYVMGGTIAISAYVLIMLFLSSISLLGATFSPFLYFRF